MTPKQKYGHPVPDDVIVHEVGHAVIGIEIGIEDGGIELCDPQTGEIARSHYSNRNATPRMLIVRAIAGAYAQADLAREQLPEELCRQILDGGIFSDNIESIREREVPIAVCEAGFTGDWANAVLAAEKLCETPDAVLLELASAHAELRALYEKRDVRAKILAIKADFLEWLDADDENVPFSTSQFYGSSRLRKQLEAFPKEYGT